MEASVPGGRTYEAAKSHRFGGIDVGFGERRASIGGVGRGRSSRGGDIGEETEGQEEEPRKEDGASGEAPEMLREVPEEDAGAGPKNEGEGEHQSRHSQGAAGRAP